VNKEAIELATQIIKMFEGYAKKLPDGGCTAYPDPGTGGDPWTIGYGSTGSDIRQHTVWTKEQAEDALQAHVRYFVYGLVKLSPSIVSATPRRIAAVISWAYNLGLGNYRISTFKKRVDAGDWEGAAVECRKWTKANGRVLPGLKRRREAEALLLQ
jgi:GH24 family phage-related lysozyme (muramidase)